MVANCPMYSQELEKVENDLFQTLYSQYTSDFEYIKNHTNLEMEGIKLINSTMTLYNSLVIEVSAIYLIFLT